MRGYIGRQSAPPPPPPGTSTCSSSSLTETVLVMNSYSYSYAWLLHTTEYTHTHTNKNNICLPFCTCKKITKRLWVAGNTQLWPTMGRANEEVNKDESAYGGSDTGCRYQFCSNLLSEINSSATSIEQNNDGRGTTNMKMVCVELKRLTHRRRLP